MRIDWALLAIVLASLAVRTAFISLPRMARWDEASYLTIARNLLAGHGYSELLGMPDVHQPPMVSLLAAAGLALHLPLDRAAAIPAQALLGGLMVLPLYALGRAVYDRRAGLLAALLGALYPALAVSPLYWGSLTEPPYMLFVLTGLYAAYRWGVGAGGWGVGSGEWGVGSGELGMGSGGWGVGSWGWAALMGVAFGLGYLSRPELLLFFFVALGYLGLVWLFSGPPRLPRLGRLAAAGAVAVAVLALTMLPYVLFLHQATGHWTLSGKAGTSMEIAWAFANQSQALHDQATASLDSTGQETLWLSPEAFDRSIAGWIAADPQRFASLVRRNMADSVDALFGQDLFQPWLALLVIFGLAGQPWTRRRLRGQALLLLALTPLASLWMVFIETRFMVVYLAISLVWAGAGLAHLSRWAHATVAAALAEPQVGWRRRAGPRRGGAACGAGRDCDALERRADRAAGDAASAHLPAGSRGLAGRAYAARHADYDPQRRDRAVRRPTADCLPARVVGSDAGLRPGAGRGLPGGRRVGDHRGAALSAAAVGSGPRRAAAGRDTGCDLRPARAHHHALPLRLSCGVWFARTAASAYTCPSQPVFVRANEQTVSCRALEAGFFSSGPHQNLLCWAVR
ncbi:MAG: glycosyltransferase family 39 protein [Anaerolineae bacterium]